MCKKICYRCSIEKDVTEFFKCGKCKDGYKSTCKLCLKDYKKSSRQPPLQYSYTI